MSLRDHVICDSDLHVMEPPDLWERYIEPEYAHAAPRGLSEIQRDMRVKVKNHVMLRLGSGATAARRGPQDRLARGARRRLRRLRGRGVGRRVAGRGDGRRRPRHGGALPVTRPVRARARQRRAGRARRARAGVRHRDRACVQQLDEGLLRRRARRACSARAWSRPTTSTVRWSKRAAASRSSASRRSSSRPRPSTAGRGTTPRTTRSGRRSSASTCRSRSTAAGRRTSRPTSASRCSPR